MLKLQVEGLSKQIQSFLYGLEQHVTLQHLESGYQIKDGKVTSCTKCEIQYRLQDRVQTLEMVTLDGDTIKIPLLDVMCVQMDEHTQIVSGKSYDIFANKKGHRTWPE
ncbi:hypothetical protein [Thermoactinomyces sp. DSM 45892]|uniref:hypothetical protein n=1 Tax=Thermoactinomyces sp. DSM 45892 TaxID=1882753 RepID=UPI00089B5D56|nr:hypothetical protein [Thermoactinomyces sp. DSM 45892]SDY35819.1 hypothetical protein SAMN05444416_10427 [Thermoactinomyces sp. DSM 45892]